MMQILLSIAVFFYSTACCNVAAFTIHSPGKFNVVSNRIVHQVQSESKAYHLNKLHLASSDEQENESSENASLNEELPESEKKISVAPEEEETSYPLDVPSPILLASSIILAIAATGSTFQLAGGDPPNGLAVTAGIAVISLPASAFLFYAAIQKGKAETEEDDRAYLNKTRRY